jgi:hypothetical protein
MEQTRLESGLEASLNTLSGFWISYFVWISIIYLSGGKQYVPDPLILTAIFTVTSLIRSYVWRRFFNQGVHKAVHRFVSNLCSNGKS